MAERVKHDNDPGGSNAALGVIIGILLVLVLLVGAWWLFLRAPVAETPDTTIIEQPDIEIEQEQQQEQPDGETNGTAPDDGTGGAQETSPSP